MISRRSFMGGGVGLGLLTSAPALAAEAATVPLVIRPSLFNGFIPPHSIIATGSNLLARLYPFDRGTKALAGFTDAADATMLRELVRVQPGASWHSYALPAGCQTPFGAALHAAVAFEARWR